MMLSPSPIKQAENPITIIQEWVLCSTNIEHFVSTYVQIYNATDHTWIPFHMWTAQKQALHTLTTARKVVMLKARQLGMSWLCLSYALWLIVFKAPSTILLFSRTATEAKELLDRLIKMHKRLPTWMQARSIESENKTEFVLSTGSKAHAFTSRGGRSFTGSLVIADEFDFVENQNEFVKAVKPTIDAGAQLFYISTSDKTRPITVFKNLFQAALKGAGEYTPIFIPWYARPGRTQAWYQNVKEEMYAQRNTHDDLYAEYPATPEEALAPEELNRRIPFSQLQAVYAPIEESGILHPPTPDLTLPGLSIYRHPQPGRNYVIGADPAEGNPNSDDSATTLLDAITWEECASLIGKFEPTVFANHISALSAYFNTAAVLAERNNHGHALIRQLTTNGTPLLNGHDDRPGWLSNIKGKPLMYDALADAVRQQATTIHTPQAVNQISTIEASTLRAPPPLKDDVADSYALAVVALAHGNLNATTSTHTPAPDPLQDYDKGTY